MMVGILLILKVLSGCDHQKVELAESGVSDPDADGDGDGWTPADGDCDDQDPAVNPGAFEVCDAADVDEDCNTFADDEDRGASGRTLTYRDADGDGAGDVADVTGTQWCDAPAGMDATTHDDCDDTNAAVNPAAADPTGGDGLDDDCDGFVDEDDLGAAGVLVTEMYWRGEDVLVSYVPADLYQWVELYNNTGVRLDLGGWTVRFCHVGGDVVAEPPTADACVDGEVTDAVLPAGTRLEAGERLVVCSDRSVMPDCDVDFDFVASGMSVRHGYVDVRAEGVTLGPLESTPRTDLRLDAVSWWYVDLTDFWPNSPSRSMRLADSVASGAGTDTVNDVYGVRGDEESSPTWSIWCLPAEGQGFELDGVEREGTPGAPNGPDCP